MLHDPFTHCDDAVQVLHGRFAHCDEAVQVLRGRFAHCDEAVQVLRGRFAHCDGAVQVLHSRFTHCSGRQWGVCNTPLPGYTPFMYPAKFAGVRRRPPTRVHVGRMLLRPYMYPDKLDRRP